MNRLSRAERAKIIGLLVEGTSLRAISRLTDHSINTVSKLVLEIGAAAAGYQDGAIRNLTCQRVQADEIWSYVYAKAKNVPEAHRDEFGYGDVWTWVAMDADTKLTVAWLVADRSYESAKVFMADVASRLANRVQLTTDGHRAYLMAVDDAFGSEIDYAMLVKIYGTEDSRDDNPTARRYSPQVCTGIEVNVMQGDPDPDHISTSYIERQNLTMRMSMRRFTRLTNAFSKKVTYHAAAIALHFLYVNFARPHKSLANPYPRTPAMAAGIADHIWTLDKIAALLD